MVFPWSAPVQQVGGCSARRLRRRASVRTLCRGQRCLERAEDERVIELEMEMEIRNRIR